jgi:hypothetical protein
MRKNARLQRKKSETKRTTDARAGLVPSPKGPAAKRSQSAKRGLESSTTPMSRATGGNPHMLTVGELAAAMKYQDHYDERHMLSHRRASDRITW